MEILDGKRRWIRGDRLEAWIEEWVENVQDNQNIEKKFLLVISKTLRALAIQCLSQK